MIRFIDLRRQNTGCNFAFWDTLTDTFIEVCGNQGWDTYKEFEADCDIEKTTLDFKRVCPKWVFEIKYEMNTKLKLYVWPAFCPDYTEGLAFAIAETLEEALEMIKKEVGDYGDYGPVTEHDIDKIAYGVYGGS